MRSVSASGGNHLYVNTAADSVVDHCVATPVARIRHALRYRLTRVRLPTNWWEQFERELLAYQDPRVVRARDEGAWQTAPGDGSM
jgi:hypothetical protein